MGRVVAIGFMVLLLPWLHLSCTAALAGTAHYTSLRQTAPAASPSPYYSENPSLSQIVSDDRNHSSQPLNLILGVVIGLVGILIALLLLTIVFVLKKKKQSREGKELVTSTWNIPFGLMSRGPSPFFRYFTCKEIQRATNGFSTIIGKGSHGAVYKAQFSDGFVAAVKELRTSQQEKDVFYRELQLLGRLHHRHLVTLRGFSAGHNRFLVFEYMENRSLKEHLQDPLKTPLNWRTRLQIAVDVAAALEYLYFFCVPPIYHVSINSSNVLLDENFVAKLSHVGFLDSTSTVDLKSDAPFSRDHTNQKYTSTESLLKYTVFQLGMLLLELVTGQSVGPEGAELIKWVQNFGLANSMHKIVDTDLGNNYDSKELKNLLIIANMCIRREDKSMISIMQMLRYVQRKLDPSIPDTSPDVITEEIFAHL